MLPVTFTRQDLRRLRRELIALAAIFAFAIAFHFGTAYIQDLLQQKRIAAQSAMNDAQSQLASVQQELTTLQHHLPIYQKLMAQHIVGEEQRLDWVETLEEIQSTLHLPALEYHFDTQRDLPVPAGTTLTHHKLRTSPMALDAYVLHEGQLITTLNAIEEQITGLPLLRSCQMKLAQGTGNARITAHCQYDWVTLMPGTPDASAGVAQ